MRILALADIHGGLDELARVLADPGAAAPDLILVAGDIVRFLSPRELDPVMALLAEAGVPLLAVAGNCDGPVVDAGLTRMGYNISGRGLLLDGGAVGIAGAKGAPPRWPQPWSRTDAEIGRAAAAGLAAIASAPVRILVTHAPPAGILALVPGAPGPVELPGSPALRQAMDDFRPDAIVCGHIHEGRSITQAGRTTVICCGSVRDGRYAVLETSPDRSPAGPRVTARLGEA